MSKTATKRAAKARKRASKARKSPLYEVRKSPLHGKGLFARRKIAEGTVIGVYRGTRVEDGERDGDHVLWVEQEDGGVYGIDGKNELRYVNHSVDPNVEFEEADLVALRDIARGEELLHHYGEDWEDV